MLTLYVAAEIYGDKQNLEVDFPVFPTLEELAKRIDEGFTVQRKMKAEAGSYVEEFKTAKLNIFNHTRGRWAELVSPTQLTNNAQIFAVGSGNELESYPTSGRMNSRLPRSHGQWTSSKLPSVPKWTYSTDVQAKARSVFEEFDTTEKGYITFADFSRVFESNEMGLSDAIVYDLYHSADVSNEGRVTWDDFLPFFAKHPNLMESVYYRTRTYWSDLRNRREATEVSELIQHHQTREKQARDALLKAQHELSELEEYVRVQKHVISDTPKVEYEQERILLAKEARLKQMNQRLSTEEDELKRNKRHFEAQHGRSPGRHTPQTVSQSKLHYGYEQPASFYPAVSPRTHNPHSPVSPYF